MDWAQQTTPELRVPSFDLNVPDNGYAWWYVDVLCPEQGLGMTLIFFLGSVFSPAYAKARRAQRGTPLAYAAVNVVLYGGNTSEWALSEYDLTSAHLDPDRLTIGRNHLHWDQDTLVLRFDETTAPFPRWPSKRLAGEVRLTPSTLFHETYALHPSHLWRPIAPVAHAEVIVDEPYVRFTGSAYHDFNAGENPLEHDFLGWSWSRRSAPEKTQILYDVQPLDGPDLKIGKVFHADGKTQPIDPKIVHKLPSTRWRMPRSIREEEGAKTRLVRTLEDAPFYSRTWLEVEQGGQVDPVMHESIQLDRFRRRFVQTLLRFRVRGARAM